MMRALAFVAAYALLAGSVAVLVGACLRGIDPPPAPREPAPDLALDDVRLAHLVDPGDPTDPADAVAQWPEYRAILAVERLLADTERPATRRP